MNDKTGHADGLADQLRELWDTRPMRMPSEGKIAGVCAGIGRRYDVDPLLVRVAFVVSAVFGGAGVGLYAAAWLVFPGPAEDSTPVGEYLRGRRRGGPGGLRLALLVLLVLVVVSAAPVGRGVGGAGTLGAVLMLAALWLLHRRRPNPPPSSASYPVRAGTAAQAGPPEHAQASAPAGTAPSSDPAQATGEIAANAANTGTTTPHRTGHDEPGAVPPAWDPLGTAPFAWDLPDPPPVTDPEPPRRRRSRLTTVTLGLALIGAAVAVAFSAAGADWLTPARIGAVALTIVAAGLLIGAFARSGYGLLIVAAPLAGFVILASLANQIHASGGAGQREYHPRTMAELQSEYRVGAGEIVLDLRGLAFTDDRTVDVRSTVGRVEVIVPESLDVIASCHTAVGDSTCPPPGDRPTGPGIGGAAGPPGAGQDPDTQPVLTLNADSTIGEVVVRRDR